MCQLTHLDDLQANFRIKNVYCSNNYLENIQGIKKFKFLNRLILDGNRLVGLDNMLSFLSRFAFLEYLTLSNNFASNPLAEEPEYRLRVIKALSSVKILDKHQITIEERRKAAALDLSDSPTKPEFKRSKNAKNGKKTTFSKLERELYKEVKSIKETHIQTMKVEEEQLRKT